MKDRATGHFKSRALIVFVFFILCLGFIAIRAYHMQVLERGRSLTVAQNQYYARRIDLASPRGTIYDSHGRELAVSMRVNSLYAQPDKIDNKGAVAARLAPILGKEAGEIAGVLSSAKPFVWLQRKITPLQQERVEALHLAGVGFIPESRRFYPNFDLGSHIIGFVGMDSQGLEGLEGAYEKYLKTAHNYVVLERDALGRWIYIPEREKGINAPYDLHLTLDLRIQYIAERELKKEVMDQRATGGMVVVMEPSTGKILAMANQPSYNPNLFEEYSPAKWRNRAVTDAFEPGSLMKVFLLAAALKEGTTKENDVIFCENGSQTIQGHTIHDMSPHGWLSMRDIIRYSSNIGSYKVGKKLGAERYFRYLDAFGFTETTGVELLGESTGEIHPAGSWSLIDLAIISFGQGVSVTSLQLITALSSIANGGNLMKPYLVERITDEDGKTIAEFSPQVRRRVLSPELCRRITAVMKEVVTSGTGRRGHIPGYEVAGKTATAQTVDLTTGKYAKDKTVASFMGFLPADEPQVAILVVVDEPKNSQYGGATAAPVFKRIAEELMQYMGVPPTGEGFSKKLILAQLPQGKKQRGSQTKRSSRQGMPDLHGLSMRKALACLDGEMVQIRLAGSGVLVAQRPSPGDALTEGSEVFLRFAPPR
ncbi:MAG: penicillin-binding protein [Deltaproteobacteria bacterium]|nr:penicillin-binding protein [Deltaproteobacteria bacterium]